MGARLILTPKLLTAAVLASLVLLDAAARGLVLALQETGLNLSAGGQVRIETVILITSTIVGLATAYLRLYVGSENNKLRQDLTTMIQTEMSKLKAELVTKEVHDIKIKQIETDVQELKRKNGV